MIRVLIVGAGDVARRLCPLLAGRFRVFVLLRDWRKAPDWRALGALPLPGDLDCRDSLQRAAGVAQWIVHLAPPPAAGGDDSRSAHLYSALRRAATRAPSLARRLVYISTSGVYGDCAGACIDETRMPAPRTDRALRRLAAERRARAFGRQGSRASILRVPGIYAADRLPLERLRAGTPVLATGDDVHTNHIHADDLAAIVRAALLRGRPCRIYHAVDDAELRMGEYFDLVADAHGLPRPPRVSRAEAGARLDPMLYSFMSESRRLSNRRLKGELGVQLRYPTPAAALAACSTPSPESSC